MQNEPQLTSVELEIEAAFGGLQPAKSFIDRDKLMFQAGQRSIHNRTWMWPITTALLTLALVFSLTLRTRPQPTERIQMTTDISNPSSQSIRQSEFSYLKIRNKVFTKGIDALPVQEQSSPANNEPLPTIMNELKFEDS
ncbi:MAG: hypothetical protein WC975_06135 [Phycisphaerae bacterium]